MQRLVKVGRITRNGIDQDAAVNPRLIRYVCADKGGTYIAFEDEYSASPGVTPIGVKSPESLRTVRRRLNRAYWLDIGIRVASFVVSALIVVFAIRSDWSMC